MKNRRKLPDIVVYSYLKYGAICISQWVFTIIIIYIFPSYKSLADFKQAPPSSYM